VVNIYNYKVPM